MWLLRVDDLQVEQCPSHGPFPPFAILSHVWMEPNQEEVTFQDLHSRHESGCESKLGWAKVQKTVEQAKLDRIDYCWIDTCCIDKRNPTELTEAINCMYNWYGNAKVCYAYLADLAFEKDAPGQRQWKNCKWFSRGWTLQELIAPAKLLVFDSDWRFVCSRADAAEDIAELTRIDPSLLRRSNTFEAEGERGVSIHQYSVAQRMSWAANRETSRPEDRAYSLVGIFGIVMQTHYGEGEENAFRRLQEEIIKVSIDQSIFAWNSPDVGLELLARSVSCFQNANHIVQRRYRRGAPYHLSNMGLHIRLPLFEDKEDYPND